MNADRLNNWLSLGANIGVLIGILLLIAELDQNSDLMRSQIAQARGDSVVQTYRDMMVSDGWLEVRAKQRAAGSIEEWVASLSPTEYERAWYRQLIDYHDLRTQFYQYQAGFLPDDIWNNETRGQVRRFLQKAPFFRFESSRSDDSEFVEFLDTIAREAGLEPFGAGGAALLPQRSDRVGQNLGEPL